MVDLITLQEYKTAKGIKKTDEDGILESLITSASAIIQNYIGRPIVDDGNPINEVITLDYDTPYIYLDRYPVSSIVSITELDPWYYDSSVHFPVAETSYMLDPAKGRLIRTAGRTWPQGPGAVSVTYRAGAIDATAIPTELKQVTIDLVTYYYKEEYKDKSVRGATINNHVSVTEKTNSFPPHIQRVLDLF